MRPSVLKELQKLGDDKEKVARKLLKKSCWGIPNSEEECPLARYLRQALELPMVEVLANRVYYQIAEEVQQSIEFLPLPCQEFVQAFDRGEYPDLIWKAVQDDR